MPRSSLPRAAGARRHRPRVTAAARRTLYVGYRFTSRITTCDPLRARAGAHAGVAPITHATANYSDTRPRAAHMNPAPPVSRMVFSQRPGAVAAAMTDVSRAEVLEHPIN